MEVEKISEACIIPSSPTPSHLKTYNISLLDQLNLPFYFPAILYYSNQQTTKTASNRSLLLKQSLSQTLFRFYPLAGRMKDDFSIDCNDEGVYYVEARANFSLSEYLDQPMLSMNKLLPGEVGWSLLKPGSYVVMVQETTFACGGFSITVLMSHMISDGIALSSFLKDWATTTRQSNEEISRPYLDSPSVFPQINAAISEQGLLTVFGPFLEKKKTNTRRFVFDASAIASLKDKAISLGVKNPTRVEVVTALLSKCLMAAFKSRSSRNDKPLVIAHSVNLRPRAVPQIPECSLGNLFWLAAAVCTPKEAEFGTIVCLLKEALGKINSDLVKKLQSDEAYLSCYEILEELTRLTFGGSDGVDFVGFTSWCNFGFYEIDFGWGKPVWTSCFGSSRDKEIMYLNTIALMDSRKEKGIEAWACLNEEVALLLENDKELLQYACVDPNP